MQDKPERRRYPRVTTELAAEMVIGPERRFAVTVNNLSQAGLQLTCDAEGIGAMFPKGEEATPGHAIAVTVSMALPETPDLQLPCRVTASRRIAERRYALNLEFGTLQEADDQTLLHYMEQQLQRA